MKPQALPFPIAFASLVGSILCLSALPLPATASEAGEALIDSLEREVPVEPPPPPAVAPTFEETPFEPAPVFEPPVAEPVYDPGIPPETGTGAAPAPAPLPDVPPPPPPPPRLATASQPRLTYMNVGDVVPSVLSRTDYSDAQGRRVQVFQFTGRQDDRLQVTLIGSNDSRPTANLRLSPYMQVLDLSAPESQQYLGGTVLPVQSRIGSDNPLVPVDNELFLRLPQTGTYGVMVYADPNEEGRFGLSVQRDRTRYLLDQVGELTDDSPTLENDDTPHEVIEFTGTQGQAVTIDLASPDFDPYLFLLDEEGNTIARDDNSGGNLNARMRTTLPDDGTYFIVVNSNREDDRGRYRLTVY